MRDKPGSARWARQTGEHAMARQAGEHATDATDREHAIRNHEKTKCSLMETKTPASAVCSTLLR